MRPNIIDVLRAKKIVWYSRLDQVEFLFRLYDVKTIQLTDMRCDTAEEDIQMHTIQLPGDWKDDWIFTDDRFNLQRGPDHNFLRFLCEMLNQLVRPNLRAWKEAGLLNGWTIQ